MADEDVELIAAPDDWSLVDPDAFDLRIWEGEAVAFVAATADTHLLSRPATVLLQRMALDNQAAGTPLQWWMRSAPALDDLYEDGLSAVADVNELLSELQRIGLVRLTGALSS